MQDATYSIAALLPLLALYDEDEVRALVRKLVEDLLESNMQELQRDLIELIE
jgi:hypothetical protein